MTLKSELLSSLGGGEGHCFICGTEKVNLDLNSNGRKLCERFCVLVGRYLNINTENNGNSNHFKFHFEKTLKTNENNEIELESEEIHCCESCFVEVEISCVFFEHLSLIQLELNARIKNFAELMKNRNRRSESDTNKTKTTRGQTEQDTNEKFRNEVISLVEQGYKDFPRLRLTKLKSVTTTKSNFSFEATSKSHHDHDHTPLPEVVHIDSSEENIDTISALSSDLANAAEEVPLQVKLSELGKSIQILGTTSNVEMLSSSFLKCRFCENCYISEGSRAEHEQTHENQQQFASVPTPRKFQLQCRFSVKDPSLFVEHSTETNLRAFDTISVPHGLVHGKMKPLRCRICGRGFTKRSALLEHEKTHSSENRGNENSTEDLNPEKPYKCQICGKGFPSELYRDRHKALHSDVRPYKCPHCGMAFKQSGSRNSHKRTHFDIRPYECGLCGYRFSRAFNCKLHQKSVHKVTNGNIIRHALENEPRNIGKPAETVSVPNGTFFSSMPTDNEDRIAEDDGESMEAAQEDNCILPDMEMTTDPIFPVEQFKPQIDVSKHEILGLEDENEHLETLESDLFDPLADV